VIAVYGLDPHPVGRPWQVIVRWTLPAVVLQTLWLSCLCAVGPMQLRIAFGFDAAFLARCAVAAALGERSRAWMVWVAAMMGAVVWVPWLTSWYHGH
jgi:hypothetical protein